MIQLQHTHVAKSNHNKLSSTMAPLRTLALFLAASSASAFAPAPVSKVARYVRLLLIDVLCFFFE